MVLLIICLICPLVLSFIVSQWSNVDWGILNYADGYLFYLPPCSSIDRE